MLRRTLGALPLFLLASTALASAGITVNKSFAPNTVALGAQSVVTVTLQNSSTVSAANISAFSDDIGTTMAGHATLLSTPTPTTTCPSGTPTISGQVLSMNNGQIPVAPSTSTPGSCTITFSVLGAIVGNGFNTIYAANVVTDLGSPSSDVTQTLSVQGANVTAIASTPGSVQIGDSSTVTYVLTNPAAVALTNVAFPITSNAALSYTITGYTTSCGGTATLPAPAGLVGTTTFSGLTIPVSGTCTVTITATTTNVTTVNYTLAASAVTDTQGTTDATGVSVGAKFVNGTPNVSKTFSPSTVPAGATSTLTLKVQNVLIEKPLTNAAISDTLPANLTISGTPTANSSCGSPVITGSGTGTLAFTGATIGAGLICQVTATVSVPASQPTGLLTNTIPINSFTSNEVNGAAAAASAGLTIVSAGGGMTMTKTATPTSVGINTAIRVTLNFTSAGGALTAGTFTDTLPQTAQPMIALTDAGHAPTFTNCGSSSPTVTFSGTGGNTVVSGSNLATTANGTCAVAFSVEFTTPTGPSRMDTNTVSPSNVTFTSAGGPVSPSGASVTLTQVPTISVNNYTASALTLVNQQVSVLATIYDSSGTADTNAVLVVNLNAGKVQLAATPNFTFTGCPAGLSASNITVTTNREQFTVAVGSISATCAIGYDVIDEAGALGSYTPGNPTYSSTLTGGVAISSTALNSVTFSTTTINVTKAFNPNQIQSGGNATADITLTVAQAGALSRTQANGVAFSDALPTGVTFSPTPNVNFTAGCQQIGQPAPGYTIAGTTISFTNISLLTLNSTPTTCDAKFDVTSTVVGAPLNQINAGAITSTSGTTNTQVAKASLTVNSGLGIAKTFVNPSFIIGTTDYTRFLVTNSASTSQLTGGTLVDAMPSTLTLASTTLGSIQAGDPALCGGSVAGPVGTSTLNLSGLTVAGSTGVSTPGQCVVYVQIQASSSAAPGLVTNTIAAGGLNIGGSTNETAATGTVTLAAPSNDSITKTFTPNTIAPNVTSVLSILIDNSVAGTANLNGMGLTDTLPTGLKVATTPTASTTCGAGTITATAGTTNVALANGSVAAGATCTITVNVTGPTGGSFTNTIAANALTTVQGATNPTAATANLTIASVALSKAFAPAAITAGGSSTLTITIPNGAIALTGLRLSDTLPSGVTIAASPNATTTCGAGTVSATAGGSVVALTGGSLAANASCTIVASVTGTVAATYTNTIPTNAIVTTQGITNTSPATANLAINLAAITLSKAFSPTAIPAGGTSLLTVTIPNTASGAVDLTAVALTDTLPAGVTIAATPNAATTCPSGTATATAGGASIALTGGTVAAGTTCTISVSVTGTAAAIYTNTIAANALGTTQGVSNTAAATANLTINLAGVALSKAFSPTTIPAGSTSTLTITVPNTAAGAVSLSGMALTDTLPTGVTIAATPNASTTCPSGTVTAVSGASSVALAGGTLAANATCTITVAVTGTGAASYTNTIAAGALTTNEGATNATTATANLTIALAATTLSKAFAPAAIAAGTTSTLTITIPNTAPGAVALTGVALTDTLPTGVTIAATPNDATTCPSGTTTAVAGGSSIALLGGTLAANASCTISVDVTGTVAASYTNTIAANALITSQGVTNAAAAMANLTINLAPISLSKVFAPNVVSAGGTSTLTITIPNTAPGAVALTGVALTDTLPTGVTIAATPNASTTCPSGTAAAAAGGSSVALSGGTIAANATCTISVDVTGTVAATYTNTIAASALVTTQGVTNSSAATANLTINLAAITLNKVFAPTAISAGGTSTLTITIPNTMPGAVALTGVALTDTLPTGVTIAATPNAATTCPAGTVNAVAGGGSVALATGTLAANATCTINVDVTGTVAATYTNTIAASALATTQGVTNSAAATANLTVNLAALTLSKAFAPSTIPAGGTSTLTVTIPNTAPGAVALTAVKVTDVLPSGVTVAAIPNSSTTCPGGVISVAAGMSVKLSNATLAANATCTFSVDVTGTIAASYTNTIPADALTTTEGVTNSAPASANLTIDLAAITLSKAFAPSTISAGGTSTLTITIPNTAPGAVALTGVGLSDTLPTGVTIAPTPNASTTCPSGTATATAGGTSIALSGGTIAANATCTIQVDVTGTVATTYTNTIAASALTTTEGVSNSAPATATLTINLAAITLSKNFAPSAIAAGGTSLLTITIPNTAPGAVALTGVALTDTLPTGVTIASTPNASTTCPSGTATATAGGTSIALAGGTIAANATCTISVNVTGTIAATYTNTIAASALTTTQGVSNSAAATANLTINLAAITLSKAFAPSAIAAGGTSILTITIPNTAPGAVALTGVALTDTLPTGVTIAPTPNASTTCPSGTATATAGGTSIALAGGTIAANAICTISVNVTGTTAATYTNTIAASALTTTQGVSNSAAATANLTINLAPITLSKSFAPNAIAAGGTSILTITIPNTAPGAVALSGVALTDTLPTGVTIAAAPNASTTCPSGTATATAGGASIALSGGTIAANTTCTISVDVTGTIAATYTNTIAASALTTTQGVSNSAPATANLTINLAAIALSKAFAPSAIAAGGTSTLTITIPNTSPGAVALTGVALTDTLPTGVTIAAAPNATTTCPSGTATATSGGTSIALSGGTIAANATCTISVNVTGTVAATYTNTIATSALTTTQGVSNATAATANLTINLAAIALSKAFAPTAIAAGGTSTLTITIPNTSPGAVALSGVALTDTLPTGVTIAPTPNASTTCPSGTATATAGGTSIALAGGTIAANTTCTISVDVTGTVAATYTNSIAASALTTTQGVSNSAAATANLTISLAAITLSKAFAPSTISAGGTSTLTITIPNTAPGAVALTGVALTDTLPTGVTIAATPNATTTCPSGTATATAGGTSIALAGGTIAAVATCTISVDVTGTAAATYTNSIAASALTTTQGVSNSVAATANLTINLAAITLSKVFAPSAIAAGGMSTLTIAIPNTAPGAVALTGVALTDTLPTGVTIAPTPNATTTCPSGTATATAGGSSIALSGGTIAANATCTIHVDVTGTVAATYTNTIAANALATTQGVSNSAPAAANLTIDLAALTLSKAFAPSAISAGGTSTLTISIPNTAPGAVALSGVALTDTLPTGVTIAATPNATTTCPSGTATATAGGTSIALAGGTIAANATCTITVNVTGTIAATYTNTIAASALTTTQGVSNSSPATANLTISLAAITLSKAFAPTAISAGGASTLTISIPNTAPGAVALTGVALTDTLPTGVTIAATPNATTTCPSGTATATAGGASIALSGGTIAANSTCTISVNVTGTIAATYTNTIAASALTTTQGVSNSAAATANLTINLAAITLSKAFAPNAIAAGENSTLTITIPNTAPGAVALTGVALTDTLPTGVSIAATPNATTTCPSGSAAATAGGASVALSGGTIAANATCTISVNVTGTVAATYTNTIAASALTTTQGVSNSAPATANLTIDLAAITINKAFAPIAIAAGGTSILTITIPNTSPGAVALSGVALTDTLPTGVTIAATPNASTTCPSGTATATAGGTSIALAGGTIAANATCTISVNVTGTVAATYTNTIAASALTTTQGVSNSSPATASLTINLAALTLSKAFAPATISAGANSTLTITIPNTAPGAVALSGVALTDTLPTGVTIAATPNASTTCPSGTVTATAGGASIALAGGTIAADATCTIHVDVTGTVAATYTNTIAASALVTTQGVSNSAPATANLTINLAAIALSKAFSPATIAAGGVSTLTITIPNTAPGAVALTGTALTDTLPTGVTVAATPNATTTCPSGTASASAGGASVALSGGTIAANATCTISVDVTGTVAATYTNTITASALVTTQGVSNTAPASANLTINLAPTMLTKAFTPATIAAGGASMLTITIPNTAPGAVALTGVALTDTLPTGVIVAAAPNASTTCPSGTVTATAGGASVALGGGTLAANATCTISVDVTGTVAATYTNTIAASALVTTQGVTNSVSATANLTINLAAITLSKAFAPVAIAAGGTSMLTITIPNTAPGAVALTGVALTDTLPTGVTIAATPNAATTCPSGTATATAGGASVALSGGTMAADATCTISVDVTGTVASTYTNTIAASALTTTQGVSNSAPATANLTINLAAIALSKVFAPATIAAGGTSTLTITIPNTAPGAVALTGVALTDTLPAGVTVASTPNASTTCPAGAATATAGGSSVALGGGTIAANATCTISVDVTGTVAATYTNTIAASALLTTQGVSNSMPATANLTIDLAAITLSKAFAPSTIPAGGTSTLTVTIPNTAPGAVALTAVKLTDVLPSGVTVAATPNTSTTCPAGVISIAAGMSVKLSNATLAANATCTFSVDVTGTIAATYTNTIAADALTNTEGVTNSAPASANLTIDLAAITLSKAFAPSTISAGGTSTLTITIPNTAPGAVALTGVALTDTLPTGVTIASTPNATTTCPSGTATATAGGASIALSGGTIAANATCTISVNVTGTIAATYTNTIAASALTTTQGVSNSAAATANLTINLAAITLSKNFAPSAIAAGGTSLLTITIPNTAPGAVALTGVALTDTLPTGVTIAPTPNATTTCPSGTATATAGGTSIALSGGTIAANATCTISVDVTGIVAATYTNTIAANALTTTQGVSNSAPATANLTINLAAITLSKNFAPNAIAAGGTSMLTITIPNTSPGAVALTGVALTDTLPTGVTIAPTPNATTTCPSGTATATAGGTSIALAGGTIAANATCTISVDVTGTVAATYTNTIAANALTTTQGVSNSAPATANLTINLAAITLSKNFAPNAIAAGGTSMLTITIPNTAPGAVALTGVALTDTLPTGVTIAPTPNASTTCPSGTATAAAGGTSIALAGGTIAANATCTISVDVTGTVAATYTNTIAASALTTTQGVSNSAPATATLTINLAAITLSKNFAPSVIAAGGTSLLTITIPNTAPGAVALTGVALTDTLPTGVTIAATPDATTTCPSGTATATAGGTSIALAGGTIAANAMCTISVNVTGTIAATYTNTIAASALTTTQGVSNSAAATANLTINLAAIALSKAFAPNAIAAGGTSMLTITIPNTAPGAIALSGVALTDTLPTGVTIAATPNASTTCPSGTATATAGGTSIALSGGAIAANATCTIAVNVTGTTAATYTNTIAASALTTTQGVSNSAPATANLTINLASISLSKAFAPSAIAAGGTSALTITIPNTSPGAVALTGLALTDTLPTGVTIAATPNAMTTCPSGTATAIAGGTSIALSGGTIAANATCTIRVDVTGTIAATYTNTIAASALVTTQGVSNATAATANLTINLAGIALSKSFAPNAISAGGKSTLTITIPNTAPGAVALSGIALTDTLPTGVAIAPTPNAATTCPAGTVTAVAGAGSVALGAGTLAANATCTFSVDVTGSTAATYTNTIAASALATTQGVTNSAPATANLTINLASIALSKAFAPTSIAAGGTSLLTITIPNTAPGAVALTGVGLTDTLPAGVTIAATPNAATTCPGGNATATAGGASVVLSGGTIAANATCTISVNVTGTVAATYTNTIAASALTTTQGVSNTAPATAHLTINLGAVALTKAFAPVAIAAGRTSRLMITIPNTAPGAIALSGLALTDTLPTGVTIAAIPNATTTCPSGTVTAIAGGGTVALAGGTVAANATCTIGVAVTGTIAATYTNTIAASALTTTQGVSNALPATANLTIDLGAIALSKAFAPSTIASGGTSTLTITIPNTAPGAIALTGVALTDALPTGVTIAAVPAAATTCAAGTVTALAGGSSVALAGGTISANAACTISVNVTGVVAGSYLNTIVPGALATTQGVTNSAPASASLTVALTGITLSKTFAPSTMTPGATSIVTIVIPNTAVGAVALSGIALTDTLPSGITIAATPNASTTCPAGTVAATAGGNGVALTGGTVAANATCTISVTVTGVVAAAYTNTIAAHALTTTQGVTNPTAAAANLTIALSGISLSKAFAPAAIPAGGTSTLKIVIPNTATGAVALTGLTLTDALPSGVTIAATPNAATTCPAGTVTANAGGTSVSLANGTLAAGATCTIGVSVTGIVAGTYVNTIPSGALSDTQSVSNPTSAVANLAVNLLGVTVSKAFAPAAIPAGGTSLLTITIPNTAVGAVALTGMTLSDALPAGVTIASKPEAGTTCPSGSVNAHAGGASVSLSNGSLAADATCTITVEVTGTTAATYTNTIPAAALSSTQGVSNPVAATANLTIALNGVTLSKAFAPSSIPAGGTSAVTISIANTADGAIALSGVSLADALPAGLTVAPNPGATTSCGTGAVTANAGAASLTLTNGSVAANATCTIVVNVTGVTAGSYTNTIAANALQSRQGASNMNSASAVLTIATPNAVGIVKTFSPSQIAPNGISTLTITIANTAPSAGSISNVALDDALPSGLSIAAIPAAATTCPSGAVTANAGATSVGLRGATLAAGASCTIVVHVTGSASNTYTNVIPAHALTSNEMATNGAAAQATLTITAATALALTVTKISDVGGAAVASGQTIAYTIGIVNTGSVSETNAKVTDVLSNATLVPGSVRVNGAVAADSVISGGAPFGSIAAGATVTIAYRATVNANAATNALVTNSATAGGDKGCAGATCTASSLPDAVTSPPAVAVTLLIDGQLSKTVILGQVVIYTANVKNVGGTAAQNVTFSDVVPSGITPIPGSGSVGAATAQGELRASSLGSVQSSATAGNVTFAGQTVSASLGTLQPGASKLVTFQAKVTASIVGVATNIVTIGATGIASVVTSNPVVANMVHALLTVTKTASATVVSTGDRVDYAVRIAAAAGAALGHTTIVDQMPAQIMFAPGSARVNGVATSPKVVGRTLTWTLPSLGVPVTLTYAGAVVAGAAENETLSNLVTVSAVPLAGGAPVVANSSASVQLVSSTFGGCYPITGRVYDDAKETGRFEAGDRGLAGVRLVLDDGESVITDAFGRYNFPCVRPGMHALRLDEQTLPAGSVPYPDRAIDSERSTRRLIHRTFDDTIVQDVNFAIGR